MTDELQKKAIDEIDAALEISEDYLDIDNNGNPNEFMAISNHLDAAKAHLAAQRKNDDALAALDMIKYHHNQVSEAAFNGYVEIIREALT